MLGRKLRIGIIGCGKMGRVHAEAFGRHPECEVAGLYNRTRQKAEDLGLMHPAARVYDDWRMLMDSPGIDVITVTTPAALRMEAYRYNAAHGRKPVFAEKPAALNTGELAELYRLARETGMAIHIDSQIRNHPAILAAESVLPHIGGLFHIDMEFSMFREDNRWKHTKIAGGGVLVELCGHMIDQADSWLGRAAKVTGINKSVVKSREVEDFSVNIIEYDGGASLLLCGNYFEHKHRLYRFRLLGEKGQIDVAFSSYDPGDARVTLYLKDDAKRVGVVVPDEICSVYPGHMDSFLKEADIFVQNIRRGDKGLDTLRKEMRTMQVIEASYLSTARGGTVALRKAPRLNGKEIV